MASKNGCLVEQPFPTPKNPFLVFSDGVGTLNPKDLVHHPIETQFTNGFFRFQARGFSVFHPEKTKEFLKTSVVGNEDLGMRFGR